LSRRRRTVSGVPPPKVFGEPQGAVVEAGKPAGVDPAAVTTIGPRLAIPPDPAFQPPSAAAELPSLDPHHPPRRRRAAK
jgi:hypothetical protein